MYLQRVKITKDMRVVADELYSHDANIQKMDDVCPALIVHLWTQVLSKHASHSTHSFAKI